MTSKAQQRDRIKQYIDEHTIYYAPSVRIRKDGLVVARKDADKTFSGPHSDYFEVGTVAEMLADHNIVPDAALKSEWARRTSSQRKTKSGGRNGGRPKKQAKP